MQENRNSQYCSRDGRSAVCIDTKVVLDCCKDRDCFEDARVYLCEDGEQMLQSATNIRTKSAKMLWAYVGVEDVPFNNGFYRISVRYYIEVSFEGCVGVGRSKSFSGLVVLSKDVVLYGGCGKAISFSSDPENNYCSIGNPDNVSTNAPVAIVETVEPIVLGTKITDCSCPCIPSCLCECGEIPDVVKELSIAISESLGAEKIAIDVSIGIDADDGSVEECAYSATATVELCFIKPGVVSYPARSFAGEIIFRTLGTRISAPAPGRESRPAATSRSRVC
jgi:hypothetical protein